MYRENNYYIINMMPEDNKMTMLKESTPSPPA